MPVVSRLSRRGLLAAGAAAALAACERAARPSAASRSAGSAVGTLAPSSPTGRPATAAPSAAAPVTALPRPGLAAVRARTGIPVLCYHQIREPTAADGAGARVYIVRPSDFAAQLDALAAGGWTPIGAEQYYRHLTTGAPLPRRPVLISLDDAARGQWPVAVPALARHRFPATFFVMTVVLDKPGWLSRRQVAALPGLGHTVAAHTWDHHPVPGYTGSDWQTQIDAPTRELARLTGRPVRFFAYPYGEWNRAAFPHLRAAGLLAAWQLSGEPLDPVEPLLTLRRRIVAGGLDRAGFQRLLALPGT